MSTILLSLINGYTDVTFTDKNKEVLKSCCCESVFKIVNESLLI